MVFAADFRGVVLAIRASLDALVLQKMRYSLCISHTGKITVCVVSKMQPALTPDSRLIYTMDYGEYT